MSKANPRSLNDGSRLYDRDTGSSGELKSKQENFNEEVHPTLLSSLVREINSTLDDIEDNLDQISLELNGSTRITRFLHTYVTLWIIVLLVTSTVGSYNPRSVLDQSKSPMYLDIYHDPRRKDWWVLDELEIDGRW